MKRIAVVVLLAASAAFPQERVFTGVITDSMCGNDHKAMNVSPDPKCVADCVRASKSVKFGLYDGANTWKLSDQLTPAQYAGRKVRITGTLYPKTGIIAVKSIDPARN